MGHYQICRLCECSPKPNHYLEWLLTGKCAFRGMCELVSHAATTRQLTQNHIQILI
jgi:hypothetical protein